MTFDELKKTWQDNQSASKPDIDSDTLLREVKRNKDNFEATILWRDFREAGVAIIMFAVILWGAFNPTDDIMVTGSVIYLAVSMLYAAAFFVIDRLVQRKKQPRHTDPLRACIEASLMQVNHQIWLLKNIFWWYILPPGIGVVSFLFFVNWNLFKALPAGKVLPGCLISTLSIVLVFWGVYWLNQFGVRKDLIPRSKELEAMLKQLANGGNVKL